MRNLLWLLIPDEAFPAVMGLAIVGATLGLLTRLISPRAAVAIGVSVVSLPLLLAAVEEGMAALPAWLAVGILIVLALQLVRAIVSLFLGGRGASHFMALAAFEIVREAVLLPFQAVRWLFRLIAGNGMR